MSFDRQAVVDAARDASYNNLERSLKVLAGRDCEDSRLRAEVIHEELARRAAEDPEKK